MSMGPDELRAALAEAAERLGVEVLEHHRAQRKLHQAMAMAEEWKALANRLADRVRTLEAGNRADAEVVKEREAELADVAREHAAARERGDL